MHVFRQKEDHYMNYIHMKELNLENHPVPLE